MPMEPEPQPMSHSSSPAARREGGEGDGADLLLGDLAVMLEQGVGQAGGEREDAGAGGGSDLDARAG